jgi:hypothetical protein
MRSSLCTSHRDQRRSGAWLAVLGTAAAALTACASGTEPSPPTPAPGASAPAAADAPSDYRLAGQGTVVLDADGNRIPITPKLVTGYVDSAAVDDKALGLSGWAAPADLEDPADVVVAFIGRRSVATVKPSVDRPDLVEGYDRPGLATAGYSISVPRGALDCSLDDGGLSIVALAGPAAARLKWLADVPTTVATACD